MNDTECRSVVKYYVLGGLSADQIYAELDKVLEGSAPSRATVLGWVDEIKNDLENRERPGAAQHKIQNTRKRGRM